MKNRPLELWRGAGQNGTGPKKACAFLRKVAARVPVPVSKSRILYRCCESENEVEIRQDSGFLQLVRRRHITGLAGCRLEARDTAGWETRTTTGCLLHNCFHAPIITWVFCKSAEGDLECDRSHDQELSVKRGNKPERCVTATTYDESFNL